jgi:hypothetical protein
MRLLSKLRRSPMRGFSAVNALREGEARAARKEIGMPEVMTPAPVATAVETTPVRSAAMEERPMVVHTIVLAFAADPVIRWCWPEAQQYLESMPAFTVAFAGGGFRDGSAYTTDGFGGAALWLPPDEHPDENAVGDIVDQTVARSLQGDLQTLMGRWPTPIRMDRTGICR